MQTKTKEEEPEIFNCHIHTFTRKNVPSYVTRFQLGPVLGTIVGWVESSKILFKMVTKATSFLLPGKYDAVHRLARFVETGEKDTQEAVFEKLRKQYPKRTKFVILPMNLDHMDGLGDVKEKLPAQLSELLAMAKKVNDDGIAKGYGRIIYPFYTVHPKQKNLSEVTAQMRDGDIFYKDNFWGLKIYPNLGYKPNDPAFREIFSICEEKGRPVMTHCTPTGLWDISMKDEHKRREYGNPNNYIEILKKHPKLKICLAHFGGAEEWVKHLKKKDDSSEEESWGKTIYELIKSGNYPNLYTDISYTVFTPKQKDLYIDLIDYLKVMLSSNKNVREHVLFGSDYYMVEREKLSEKEVSILLRSRLGDDLFFQIAHTNPKRFLGIR